MSTIRIRNTKRGTTVHMRAGKGEDLRDVVAALAGETPEQPKQTWYSINSFSENDVNISPVTVLSSTPKRLTIEVPAAIASPRGPRSRVVNKLGVYQNYYPTWEKARQAKIDMISRAIKTVDRQRNRLSDSLTALFKLEAPTKVESP